MRIPFVLKGGVLLGSIALLGVGCPQQQAPLPPPQSPARVVPQASPAGTQATPVSTAPASDVSAGSVVSITATGFSPATVTVPKGSTVTFRNGDTKPHWVASNPHPVHTGLAGFDAGAPIPPGQTYVFQFTQAGTFGYHDHLNPGVQGQVVVQ